MLYLIEHNFQSKCQTWVILHQPVYVSYSRLRYLLENPKDYHHHILVGFSWCQGGWFGEVYLEDECTGMGLQLQPYQSTQTLYIGAVPGPKGTIIAEVMPMLNCATNKTLTMQDIKCTDNLVWIHRVIGNLIVKVKYRFICNFDHFTKVLGHLCAKIYYNKNDLSSNVITEYGEFYCKTNRKSEC